MSVAHAVETKSADGESAASRNRKKAQAVTGVIPGTQTGFSREQFHVQRKENACACGGGCPKCLGTLGIQAKHEWNERGTIKASGSNLWIAYAKVADETNQVWEELTVSYMTKI